MCHGFMGDKDENTLFSSLSETLEKHSIGSFRFDFAGCGESDDTPLSLSGMEDDLLSSMSFLETAGFDHIVGLGHSLGCVPLIRSHERFDDLLLLSPYYKEDRRRIKLIEAELDKNDTNVMKNRFGEPHTLTESFLEEMRSVDLAENIPLDKTTLFLAKHDEIMPDKYYDILLKKDFNNIFKLETNHFYTEGRKKLFTNIISMIKDL